MRLFPAMYYLSVGSVIKNEAQFLKEWIIFHLYRGVEHFFLLDNNSTDNTFEVLKPFIDVGVVTYGRYKNDFFPQMLGFTEIINFTKDKTFWLALIDPDEFIQTKLYSSISLLLEEYEGFSALAAHWLCFGSSKLTNTPKQVISLYRRAPYANHINNKIKCFVRPGVTAKANGSHWFDYTEGFAVNEKFEKMPGDHNIPKSWCPKSSTGRRIRICHYPIKSYAHLAEKIKRGYVDRREPLTDKEWKLYQNTFDINTFVDKRMAKYVEHFKSLQEA